MRSVDFGASGTLVAKCEQIEAPSVETATVTTGVYDPIQDKIIGTPVQATVVRMRWQSLFTYRNSIAPKFEPGDIQVAIAKTVAGVAAGTTLGLSDGLWRVESVAVEGLVWVCRATRYGG